MKPYFERNGITIYHRPVVKCDAWKNVDWKLPADTVPANEVRTYPFKSVAQKRVTNRARNTSRSASSGVRIILRGWATLFQKKVVAVAHCASIATSALVRRADSRPLSATIATGTPQTTPQRTSQFYAEFATWKRTVV